MVLLRSSLLRKTCLARFIAHPMTGMSMISDLERYLNGRGTKPLKTRMSMKEVWLGTYMTVSPSLGRFSTPYTLGLHRVIWCAKCAVRVRPYKQTRSHERTEETKSNREVIIGHGGKKIARRELRVEVEVEWVGSLGGWVEGSEVWVGGVYVVVLLLLVT